MLFNSDLFVYLFLPSFLLLFSLVFSKCRGSINLFVVLASLLFYAYHDPSLTIVILASIGVNLVIAKILVATGSRALLAVGVSLNLLYLGYFKYTCFFVDMAYRSFLSEPPSCKLSLPLAISFFTFQQIAYLVDVCRLRAAAGRVPTLTDYTAFAVFFPHLIAGPIARFNQLLEPIQKKSYRIDTRTLELGAFIFTLGFVRKVYFADNLAYFANPVFDAAKHGVIDASSAAVGIVAFSLQIYFDFCGYSEMAVGLALMIGIKLPWNFERPYASLSVIDFWRRWHITLSTFLRDYLYIPLGGSRRNRYRNLLVTMLLGGLWHGAGWTFLVWGLLHGLYLAINHFYRCHARMRFPNWASFLVTSAAVSFAWIFFRAEGMVPAWNIILSLFNFADAGRSELFLPFFNNLPFQLDKWKSLWPEVIWSTAAALLLTSYSAAIVWDTQAMTKGYRRLPDAARLPIMIAFALLVSIGLHWQSSGAAKFIYFEF